MEEILSKIKITGWLLIIGGFFIWSNSCLGANNDVFINEIAWMGTETSSNDEWIELYNSTNECIDLTGWTLKAIDSSPEIFLEGTIAVSGYFLLERTDDDSVPNIVADQIYTGALGNSGEKLELRDSENNLISSIDCSEEWLAGDNSTKQTMEKINSNWQTSLDIHGTPKAQNSNGNQETPPEDNEEQSEEELGDDSEQSLPVMPNRPPIANAGLDIIALVNQEMIFDSSLSSDPDNDTLTFFWNFGDGATDTEGIPKHTYLYPGQYIVTLLVSDNEFSDLDIITVNVYNKSIIISEFMPDPEGTDTENEWIELYNQSNQIANLTNWQIDDQEDGSSPFIFPSNSLIGPEQFLVLRRSITKIALNNDNDQVRLLYPDGSLATEVNYLAEKKQGFSVAFDGYDYFWTKIITPGSANIISLADLKNKDKSISSNNPQPIIEQSQEIPEIMANINLNQGEGFNALNPTNDSVNSQIQDSSQLNQPVNQIQLDDILSQQSISLSKSIQTNQKANLILTLSIIISGSLMFSWFLIRLRKIKFH